MSNKNNTDFAEEARMNLEEACKLGDWAMARAVIADLEDNGFDASYTRRFMNLAMAESDDIELVPVAPGVYQSQEDIDNNNQVDEARGN